MLKFSAIVRLWQSPSFPPAFDRGIEKLWRCYPSNFALVQTFYSLSSYKTKQIEKLNKFSNSYHFLSISSNFENFVSMFFVDRSSLSFVPFFLYRPNFIVLQTWRYLLKWYTKHIVSVGRWWRQFSMFIICEVVLTYFLLPSCNFKWVRRTCNV